MDKSYLNISCAPELADFKQRIIYRFFEMLIGFLSLGTLIAALILSIFMPAAVAIFIIIFDFYWLLKITYLSFHQISCFRKMKKNLKIDWTKKLDDVYKKEWEDIYHLILLPFYKEDKEMIKSSINALIKTSYPKEKFIIALAAEEKGGESARIIASELKSEFSGQFFQFLTTIHPQNIPGEIQGKGSNAAFAINKARHIVDELNIPYENILVSNFDIDTRPYSQYFSCLTFNFLANKRSLRISYQPIPIYNNNIWQAPLFSRVIAASGTFWQMMQQERPEVLVSFSTHSIPLKVLYDVGYPTNLMSVNDDSHIFWKAYFHYDGDYKVMPMHYPVSMDAVTAESFSKTAINQYKQQLRWAWGCTEIPYIFYGFLKNKKIALKDKLRHSYIILDGFWSWATSSILIFFLGWFPLILGGQVFQESMLSYNLPRLTSYIMTLAMVGMIVSAIISLLILPERPKNFKKWKNALIIFQWLFLPITLIIFGNFPALEAQSRLLFGKRLKQFCFTEKIKT